MATELSQRLLKRDAERAGAARALGVAWEALLLAAHDYVEAWRAALRGGLFEKRELLSVGFKEPANIRVPKPSESALAAREEREAGGWEGSQEE